MAYRSRLGSRLDHMQLTVTEPGVLAWADVPSRAVHAGEVTVRTRLSAVSVSSELSEMRGLPGHVYPRTLGYQTLGVIESRGEDVPLPVGQRVVCTLGHASHGVLDAARVIPVPERVPDHVALCVILGEETHKGIRKMQPRPQDRVLVAGAGLLGLLTVFNLTRRGVPEVTVLEPDLDRRALALAFGAVAAFAPGDLPRADFDVDVGVECSASPAGFTELLLHLRPGGRCVVLSDGNWGALVLPPEFHARELSVTASSDGQDYHAYARWLWDHADPVLEDLFQQTVTPGDLIPAFGRLGAMPRPVSVLVDWS